jgi:hypothetical protein
MEMQIGMGMGIGRTEWQILQNQKRGCLWKLPEARHTAPHFHVILIKYVIKIRFYIG